MRLGIVYVLREVFHSLFGLLLSCCCCLFSALRLGMSIACHHFKMSPVLSTVVV